MTSARETWTLPVAVKRAVLEHARSSAPEECCGLLVGARRSVVMSTAMPNVAADRRRRYRIDQKEHIAIHRWLRRSAPAMQIVGVYHSHPHSAARPSPADVAEAFYADWLYLIVGRVATRAVVSGFRIRNGAARRVALRWRSSAPRPAR